MMDIDTNEKETSGSANALDPFFEGDTIGIQEWQIGFQNVYGILDTCRNKNTKIESRLKKQKESLDKNCSYYWKAASQQTLKDLKSKWWKSMTFALIGSVFVDVIANNLPQTLVFVFGKITDALPSSIKPNVEEMKTFFKQANDFLMNEQNIIPVHYIFDMAGEVLSIVLGVAVGYFVLKFLKTIKPLRISLPTMTFALDDIFTDKEVKARKKGLNKIYRR